MSWQSWVRTTAARLGIGAAPPELTLQQALDRLRPLEEELSEGRMRLIEQAEIRDLTVEEIAAFEIARKQVLATTLIIRSEMLRVGVPVESIPTVVELAEIPRVLTQPRVAASGSTAFGAVRTCSSCAPAYRSGSFAEVAGTFGGWQAVAIVGFAAVAATALAVAAYFLQRTIAPEVALQEAITEAQVAYFTAIRVQAEAQAAAIAACVADPECHVSDLPGFTPPAPPNAGVHPIVQGISGLSRLLIVGALGFGGYLLWKASKK